MNQVEEHASASGRIMTIGLIVLAVVAALYLALGNSTQQPPKEEPDVRTGIKAWAHAMQREVAGVSCQQTPFTDCDVRLQDGTIAHLRCDKHGCATRGER
jgi:hypothetical protein